MHFDEEMGFQFLGPRSTVLSPSDPRPPRSTVLSPSDPRPPTVFRQKGAAPWEITRAEKLQLSVLLPNDLSLEDWYAGCMAYQPFGPRLLCWVLTIFAAGCDFHLLRKKYDVRTMWGES